MIMTLCVISLIIGFILVVALIFGDDDPTRSSKFNLYSTLFGLVIAFFLIYFPIFIIVTGGA